MAIAKRFFGAFVVGGCAGAVGQLFVFLFSLILPDPMLATILGILCLGVIGAALIVAGVYPKISKFGAFGADQPVCGLMYGASGITAEARKAGAPAAAAFRKGFGIVALIVFSGFFIAVAVGVAFTLIARGVAA
jgi:hypothetical protein